MAGGVGGVRKRGVLNSPTVVTARRAFGITKTYIAIAIFMSVLAIAVWGNVMYVNSGAGPSTNSTASNSLVGNAISPNAIVAGVGSKAGSGTPLLALPLDMVPFLMIATPVVLLFVYDKNNGVLEYMLSLGMSQRDIYMQYLKATIFITLLYSVVFIPAVLAYGYAVYGASAVAAVLPIPFLAIPFALAVVGFLVMAMMGFSSLQKTRAGSNQPLGLAIGFASTAPAYLVPFLFPFETAIYVDIVLIIALAVITLIFLVSAGKLIRREKFLP
jgi:hypothetical protein